MITDRVRARTREILEVPHAYAETPRELTVVTFTLAALLDWDPEDAPEQALTRAWIRETGAVADPNVAGWLTTERVLRAMLADLGLLKR